MGLFDKIFGSSLTSSSSFISHPFEKRRMPGDPNPEEVAKVLTYVIKHTPLGSLGQSMIDNVFRESVKPILGSILHCSLYGVEHTGVYVGSNRIVELTRTGEIRQTDPKGFIEGTNAITIYVACNGTSPLGSPKIAETACSMVGSRRKYNVILNNCHQFTAGCISGNFENLTKVFNFLEDSIKHEMSGGNDINWRAWDLSA